MSVHLHLLECSRRAALVVLERLDAMYVGPERKASKEAPRRVSLYC